YLGSMFRYERPQAGRLREHHQFGCEAIGSDDALLDASLVDLQHRFYRRAGVEGLTVQVNSIGDGNCRPAYIVELVSYLRAYESHLCGQCQDRIERNPLRVLDCKVESCQPVLDAAPRLLDHLCGPCKAHWDRFLAGLNVLGLAHTVNSRLVRGLDYYTRSVWEILPDTPGGAQSVLGGGGRYDALAAAIGAPATPAVGFSTGLERVLLNIKSEPDAHGNDSRLNVFIAQLGDAAELKGLEILRDLYEAGLSADMAFENRSLGTQLKQASARGARIAVIMGEDEMAGNVATVRDLASRTQETIPLERLVETLVEQA
ncbi:MAG TPA: histidine--tRNA ligase, partial [Chloroflexota bacterium]|nr:histidine--tRNA ligase [Chloroflexota bacterium]